MPINRRRTIILKNDIITINRTTKTTESTTIITLNNTMLHHILHKTNRISINTTHNIQSSIKLLNSQIIQSQTTILTHISKMIIIILLITTNTNSSTITVNGYRTKTNIQQILLHNRRISTTIPIGPPIKIPNTLIIPNRKLILTRSQINNHTRSINKRIQTPKNTLQLSNITNINNPNLIRGKQLLINQSIISINFNIRLIPKRIPETIINKSSRITRTINSITIPRPSNIIKNIQGIRLSIQNRTTHMQSMNQSILTSIIIIKTTMIKNYSIIIMNNSTRTTTFHIHLISRIIPKNRILTQKITMIHKNMIKKTNRHIIQNNISIRPNIHKINIKITYNLSTITINNQLTIRKLTSITPLLIFPNNTIQIITSTLHQINPNNIIRIHLGKQL